MSEKPVCRVQFQSADEYWTLVKLAAQHDLKLPEFLHRCAIKVANDIFAEREEGMKPSGETNEEEQQEYVISEAEVSSSEEESSGTQTEDSGPEVQAESV